MSDLDNLKRQVAYTFLDAYGNFDGADILFEAIVRATEERIRKVLQNHIYDKLNYVCSCQFDEDYPNTMSIEDWLEHIEAQEGEQK